MSKIQVNHLTKVADNQNESRNKISIIGSGNVAITVAFSILLKELSNDIVIITRDEEKTCKEVLEMTQGLISSDTKISASDKVSQTSNSKLIIFAAGVKQNKDQSRLESLQKNAEILREIVPWLANYSPKAVLLVVTSPSDVLCHVAWKLSGFPKNRVIGVGTNLENSIFRNSLSTEFDIISNSMHGWIIGEQGEASFPVWSSVSIAGVNFQEINPEIGLENDAENWSKIHQEAISNQEEVIKLKGYSSWGIGSVCASLAASILSCKREIKVVSTNIKGLYGIEKDIFMSLPCVLSCDGVSSIISIKLINEERKKLRASAYLLEEIIKNLVY
jgi:L-lactate dehydrogenase